MGFGSSFKSFTANTLGKVPGFESINPYTESAVDAKNRAKENRAKALGLPEGSTSQQITTANLFRNLTTEQQKDLLLNNHNITTP